MINLNFQLYVEKSVHGISIKLRSANGRFFENFWPHGNAPIHKLVRHYLPKRKRKQRIIIQSIAV